MRSTLKPAVDVAQTPWELDRLLDIARAHAPLRVLELGIWEGGTLWEWLHIAEVVVAIDDTMRNPGPGEWKQWAKDAGSSLRLLHGYSDDPLIADMAGETGPFDLVFIDADHTYPSVRGDYERYGPMVEEGGVIVFHDILPRPGYGVDRLWQELKTQAGARTVEIIEAGNESANGIGLIWMR